MKITLLILSSFLIVNLYCQPESPFPYLASVKIENFDNREFHYVKRNSEIINKKRIDLPKNHKYYAEECEGEFMTIVGITTFDKTGKKIAIAYSVCPDPEFTIYDDNNPKIIIGTINADKLYINGNGSLYCSGGEGTFDARKKYVIDNNQLKEIKQDYYYVGLKSKTLNPIEIFETVEYKNSVAKLPADYPVEIILSDKAFNGTSGNYLVKTKFGLIGWARLRARQYSSHDIEGLMYKGD